MRVSKTVREYIEKQVERKLPKTENELNYDRITQTINTANEEYHRLMEQAKQNVIVQLVEKYGLEEDMVEKKSCYSYAPFGTWGTKARQLNDQDHQNRVAIFNQKVEEIVVNLELGGTKADLEKMLAEI